MVWRVVIHYSVRGEERTMCTLADAESEAHAAHQVMARLQKYWGGSVRFGEIAYAR